MNERAPQSTDDMLLEVKNLSTWFETGFGTIKAVQDASFNLKRGKTLCVVGESGSGKSVAARSILQIVPRPGRIMSGEILLHGTDGPSVRNGVVDIAKLDPRGREVRAIRGRDISMIFQEPMSSLSPVHTIGHQIVEAIVEQLTTLPGSEVKLRLEIEAEVPSGLERTKVRTLVENATTLGFIEKSIE